MSDGSMGDAGGGGGDFGGGYSGFGGGKISTYITAAIGVVGGAGLMVLEPSAWWFGALMLLSAVFIVVMAQVGPKIRARNGQRLKRKPGEEPTFHDLE